MTDTTDTTKDDTGRCADLAQLQGRPAGIQVHQESHDAARRPQRLRGARETIGGQVFL